MRQIAHTATPTPQPAPGVDFSKPQHSHVGCAKYAVIVSSIVSLVSIVSSPEIYLHPARRPRSHRAVIALLNGLRNFGKPRGARFRFHFIALIVGHFVGIMGGILTRFPFQKLIFAQVVADLFACHFGFPFR
jgi:hypothetical protein